MPDIFGMAKQAILREVSLAVAGIDSSLVISLMAAVAFARQIGKLVIYVTVDTLNIYVGAAKLELAGLKMIEFRPFPTDIAMTGLAIGWKAKGGMGGIGGGRVIGLVTTQAEVGSTGESRGMTTGAIGLGVSAMQGKSVGMLIGGTMPTGSDRLVT